jgi:hypothetical protein
MRKLVAVRRVSPLWVKGLLAAVLAAVLILGTAQPSSAIVSKSGSKSCPSGKVVALTGYGEGTLIFYFKGVERYRTYHGLTYASTWKSSSRSGTWKITSNGSLYDRQTYAWCAPSQINSAPPEEEAEEGAEVGS